MRLCGASCEVLMRGGLLILLAALLVACVGAIDAGLCAWTLFAAMLFLAGAAVEGAESVGDGAAKGVVGSLGGLLLFLVMVREEAICFLMASPLTVTSGAPRWAGYSLLKGPVGSRGGFAAAAAFAGGYAGLRVDAAAAAVPGGGGWWRVVATVGGMLRRRRCGRW